MECPTSWSLRAGQSGQGRRPGQHLICCPSRESQQEDALGRCPALEQAGDSCGERSGLAGPGPSHDHQGLVAVGRDCHLRLVQAVVPGGKIEHAFDTSAW